MTVSKKYFHDHFVLLLLSINVFLAIADTIFLIVRISTTHGNGFIVQYRPSVGIDIYTPGNILGILSFIAFVWVAMVSNSLLSLKVYPIHRQVSIAILSLGVLLLLLAAIISNSLLLLR